MPVIAIGAFIASAVTEVGAFVEVATAGVLATAGIGGVAGGVLASALAGGIVTAGELFALTTASDLLLGKSVGKDGGTQVNFMANPQAGVPYAIGRTGTAGNIVMVDSAGTNSAFLTYITVLSLGPIAGYEKFSANTIDVQFTADNGEGANTQNATTSVTSPTAAGATVVPVGTTTGFATGNTVTISDGVNSETKTLSRVDQSPKELSFASALAHSYGIFATVTAAAVTSGFKNRMWLKTSLGGSNAAALTFTSTDSKDTPANHSGIPAVWTSSCQLSGLAATMWTLEFDAQVYSGGTPGPMNVIRGVLCYDPRQDSTYAGGSGGCRSNDETTWVFSQNPYVHALTWLIGRSSNGVKTMGVHASITAIDVAAFIAGMNIADANGWTCGGVIYSTDSKWDVLVSLLQAGSGTPLKLGAKISCMVNTPLVSLDTLTGADVVGKAMIPTTTPARDRVNVIWPRYREEQQGWQIVPALTSVSVPSYITADGGQRVRETEYTLVQNAGQAAVLARYDIENAREIQTISLPCKPRWMGYKPGDCITINEPEYGLNNQTMLIVSRDVDPATLITTLGLRTETPGKHAFALGQTSSAPATPTVTGVDPSVFAPPGIGVWTATAATIVSDGTTLPVINVTGASDNPLAATVIVEYSPSGSGDWISWSETAASTTTLVQITGLAPGQSYDVGVRYRSVKGVISDRTVISGTGLANLGGSYGAYLGTGAGDILANISYSGGLLFTGDLITSQGTSADTNAVGGTSSSAVLANIAAAAAAAAQALTNITAINTTLTASVTTAQTAANNALSDVATADANLTAEIANRESGDATNAQAITDLTTTVDGNASAITTEAQTRANADSTLSGLVTSLTSTVTSNNATQTANLTSEAGTRASADSTLSASITTLTTNYNELSSKVGNNYTSLSNAQSTTAAAVTTLQSEMATNTAGLSSEAVTRASADSALSAEITTLTSDYSGLSSTVSTNYTTLSNSVSTLSSTVTSLSSAVTANDNTLTASITSEATTRAAADQTLTNSINTLTSNYNNLSSTVSTNEATAASANSATATEVTGLQAQIWNNNNLVPGGNFEQGFATWTWNAYGATCIAGANEYQDPNYGQLGFIGAFTGGTVAIISETIACTPGQTMTLSGNIQVSWDGAGSGPPLGMECYLDRLYFDSAGNLLTGTGDGAQTDGVEYILAYGSTTPNYVFSEEVPAGAAKLQVRYIAAATTYPSGSGINCYAQRIKLEHGPVATPYSSEASVTSVSSAVATLQGQTASYLQEVSTSGGTAFVELLSTSGGISEVVLKAANIYLGANIAANDATATITFTESGHMNVIGAGFGTSGQFVEWFGPAMGVSACSEANAISYKRVDGAAYFAGALSAGSVSTSNLASGAASAIVETTWTGNYNLTTTQAGITSIGVASTGGKHQITAQLTVSAIGSANTGVVVTLSRDGTNIISRNVLFPNSFTSSHLVAFYDVPGAGSHTYVIAVSITSGSSTSSVLTALDLMSIEFRAAA